MFFSTSVHKTPKYTSFYQHNFYNSLLSGGELQSLLLLCTISINLFARLINVNHAEQQIMFDTRFQYFLVYITFPLPDFNDDKTASCSKNVRNSEHMWQILDCQILNLIISIPLCTCNKFIALYRLYTTYK